MGRMMAFDTRYEVKTHELSSSLTESEPAMCGSDGSNRSRRRVAK
jgi:hypothetical protein